MITSKNHEKVKFVCKLLSSKSFRHKNNLMVLEGERLITEAEKIKELYYVKKEIAEKFLGITEKSYEVSEEVFKKISDTVNPQGILALVEIPDTNGKIDLNGKYMAFENIQDPSNLGAAARSLEAFGINGIIVNGVDPYSPKVLRASMGAILRMQVIMPNDILECLKNVPMRKIGMVVSGGESIRDFEFKNDIAVIGNEANGLTEKAKELCDNLITINMKGPTESLNAAVAAAVTAWEMQK